jgi:hypothetical protein
VVLTTNGKVPLPETVRLAQKPIDVSVSPWSTTAFHEQQGVTDTGPLEPTKFPFHDVEMVEALVSRFTVKLVVGMNAPLVTFNVAQ